jgi:hypothetical protein
MICLILRQLFTFSVLRFLSISRQKETLLKIPQTELKEGSSRKSLTEGSTDISFWWVLVIGTCTARFTTKNSEFVPKFGKLGDGKEYVPSFVASVKLQVVEGELEEFKE